jgi:hypothetical protein
MLRLFYAPTIPIGYNGEVWQRIGMYALAKRNLCNNGSIKVVTEVCKLFIRFSFVIICANRASHLFRAEWRRMDVGPLLSESTS